MMFQGGLGIGKWLDGTWFIENFSDLDGGLAQRRFLGHWLRGFVSLCPKAFAALKFTVCYHRVLEAA